MKKHLFVIFFFALHTTYAQNPSADTCKYRLVQLADSIFTRIKSEYLNISDNDKNLFSVLSKAANEKREIFFNQRNINQQLVKLYPSIIGASDTVLSEIGRVKRIAINCNNPYTNADSTTFIDWCTGSSIDLCFYYPDKKVYEINSESITGILVREELIQINANESVYQPVGISFTYAVTTIAEEQLWFDIRRLKNYFPEYSYFQMLHN